MTLGSERIRRILGMGREPRAQRNGVWEPPRCPDGMSFGPPDFVGIGAQKAGTTWWMNLIGRHPQVYMPDFEESDYPDSFPKERHFFDLFFEREFGPEDVEQYHRWFPRPPGQYTGEWTPRYMVDPWVPPLLKQAAADARILVMLRDPVARFPSGIAQRQKTKKVRGDHALSQYLRGLYARQLQWWLEHFPRQQLLILQYEQCVAEPQEQFNRTTEFLTLQPLRLQEEWVDRTWNPRHTAYQIPAHLRQTLESLYRPDVRKLMEMVPELDPELWVNF